MKVIGINGFKRSGKGTCASILNELVEDIIYEIGFADKLKIMSARSLGFDRHPLELIKIMDEFKIDGKMSAAYREPGESSYRIHDLSGREFLQHFGNRARDTFGDNFWIDQVLPYPALYEVVDEDGLGTTTEVDYEATEAELMRMYPGVDLVVITDVRYPNEASRIKDLGGVVWEVVRPGVESDGHASEQPLPRELVDHTIDNSGDLNFLTGRVDDAITETLR